MINTCNIILYQIGLLMLNLIYTIITYQIEQRIYKKNAIYTNFKKISD